MNKKRLILIIIIAIAVVAFTVGIILIVRSCNNKSSIIKNDGNQIVIGGDSSAIVDDTVEIVGATDVYLTLSDTTVDVDSYSVVVVSGEDVFDAKLDFSQVTFGTQGTYKITWYYGDNLESAKAKIEKELLVFSSPSISNELSNATYKYSKAFLDIYEKIVAKDCFGVNLALGLDDDGGLFNYDGTVNIGTFTVQYKAYDRVGQIVTATRTITIESEISISLSDKYLYDVYDEFFYLDTSGISQKIIGVSVDGKIIPEKYIKIDDSLVRIDGIFLKENFAVGQTPPIKLIFNNGTCSSLICIEDKENIGLVDGEIYNDVDGFNTPIRSGYTLNRLEVREYNNPSAGIYALYDASSVTYSNFDSFNNVFKRLNTKYTYLITGFATKGGVSYEQTVSFKIVKDGFSVLDSNTLAVYSNNPSVTVIEKQREIVDNKCAYEWKAVADKAYTSDALIKFNKTAEKGDYLTFDIQITEKKLVYLSLFNSDLGKNNAYNMWDRYLLNDPAVDMEKNPTWGGFDSYTYGHVKFYDQNGEVISGNVLCSDMQIGKWITVEIKLQGDLIDGCGLTVHSNSPLNSGSILLANMTISKNSLMDDSSVNKEQLEDPYIEDVFGNN